MLSNPNVKQIMPKVGNRYECALAIAKRARYIEKKRIMTGSRDITDSVDVAAKEIANGEAFVKINGKYVVSPDEENVKDIEENKEEEDNKN